MSSPISYYLALKAVMNDFNMQLRSTLPKSNTLLTNLANDPNYASCATDSVKSNVATLQGLVAEAAKTLATINWDNI